MHFSLDFSGLPPPPPPSRSKQQFGSFCGSREMLKVLHQILMTVLAQGSSRNVCISDINGTARSGGESGGGRRRHFRGTGAWSVQGGDCDSKAAWVRGAGTEPQGAGWVGASPTFCNCRAATDLRPEGSPPHSQPATGCPPSRTFPRFKVDQMPLVGRDGNFWGQSASWQTDQCSEELRHRAGGVRRGCEVQCQEWQCQSAFVRSTGRYSLESNEAAEVAPLRLAPASAAENSS